MEWLLAPSCLHSKIYENIHLLFVQILGRVSFCSLGKFGVNHDDKKCKLERNKPRHRKIKDSELTTIVLSSIESLWRCFLLRR